VQEDGPESEHGSEEVPESQGEDIEGVEYDREEETEDQETSQDRAMMTNRLKTRSILS
jgi:hypothetical protein